MISGYKSAYCTLNGVIQQLNADSNTALVSTTGAQNTQILTESANTQAELKRDIYEVSALMSQQLDRDFLPYVYTHTWQGQDYREGLRWDSRYLSYIFKLPTDLLSVTTLTWNGTAITSGDYVLHYTGIYPAFALRLDREALTSFPVNFDETITLLGIWGYHRRPAAMWVSSGQTVQNVTQISATGTTLTVTTGGAFEVLGYLRIESEYLHITAIAGNSLTVERGVLGTTGAIHANGTAIDTYQQTPEVDTEARRLAIRQFALRNGLKDPNNFVASGEGAIELTLGDVRLALRRPEFMSANL